MNKATKKERDEHIKATAESQLIGNNLKAEAYAKDLCERMNLLLNDESSDTAAVLRELLSRRENTFTKFDYAKYMYAGERGFGIIHMLNGLIATHDSRDNIKWELAIQLNSNDTMRFVVVEKKVEL